MNDQETNQSSIITPWNVKFENGQDNLDKLINEFGVEPITNELLEKFTRITGMEPHPWIKRGIFFAHRQLNEILNDHEQGKKIFLYTGRGPSSESLHIGHMPSFMFTKWLQDVFNAIVIIQIADDEKVYFKNEPFDKIYNYGFENAKDIIACGFNREKTFIFSNRDYSRTIPYQTIVCELMRHIHLNKIQAVFGIPDNAPIGQVMWPVYQIAASFSQSFEPILGKDPIKCLICYGIDQDVYNRIGRDVATSINHPKPCSIIMKFLPSLEGTSKMNSTNQNGPITTIFMNSDKNDVYNKIKKYAFSGGKETLKEHREKGANLDIDIPYQYLRFFEFDEQKLEFIANEYKSGKMLTSEIKKIVSDKIIELIENHQKNRSQITNTELAYFYDINKFKF